METIFVDRTFTGSNISTYCDNMIETIIVPKLSSFSNVSYIGKKSVTNNSEYFFKVNNSENIYLMLRCTGTLTNQARSVAMFLTSTADTSGTTATTFLNGGTNTYILQPSNKLSWTQNYSHISFYWYLISDTDNNLKVIYTINPTYEIRTHSQPVVFEKTAKNKNAVIQFTTGSNNLNCFYDDNSSIYYYIPQSSTSYDSLTDVLKINNVPIAINTNVNNVVDSITNGKMTRIFNANLDAVYNTATNNNDSGMIRKLIRVGSTYYRQLVSNFWYEDPKGDEEVEVYNDSNVNAS